MSYGPTLEGPELGVLAGGAQRSFGSVIGRVTDCLANQRAVTFVADGAGLISGDVMNCRL